MHVLVCSECMRTFVHVKERSCALTAWQLLYRERERERERDRVRRALPDLDLRWQQSNVKKNAELLPRGDGYLQTGQYVSSDHGRVLNSLK